MSDGIPRRRLAVWGAGFALVLVALHGGAWWGATRQIEAGWPGFIAQAAAYGWRITAGEARRGGWPATAAVEYDDVVAERPFGAATLRLRFERLSLKLSPTDLHGLLVEPSGTQTVAVGEGAPVSINTAAASLRVALDGSGTALAVRGLEVSSPGGAGGSIASLDAVFASGTATVSAQRVQTRPVLPAPFDGGGALSFRAEVRPTFPIADTPAASAAAWRDAGGRIEVPAFVARWGKLAMEGQAAGGLDGAMQPELAGTMDVEGSIELLDGATQAGLVTRPVAQAARAVLGIMSMATPGGRVRLPFTLSGGTLEVARFPLARLPELDWGAR